MFVGDTGEKKAVGVKPTPGQLRTKAFCAARLGFDALHKKGATITKPEVDALAHFINARREALIYKNTHRVTQREHVLLAMHPTGHSA